MNRVGPGTLYRQNEEWFTRPNTEEEHVISKKMKEARTLAEGNEFSQYNRHKTSCPFILLTPAVPLVSNAVPHLKLVILGSIYVLNVCAASALMG